MPCNRAYAGIFIKVRHICWSDALGGEPVACGQISCDLCVFHCIAALQTGGLGVGVDRKYPNCYGQEQKSSGDSGSSALVETVYQVLDAVFKRHFLLAFVFVSHGKSLWGISRYFNR